MKKNQSAVTVTRMNGNAHIAAQSAMKIMANVLIRIVIQWTSEGGD
jgi:hypothetical protein